MCVLLDGSAVAEQAIPVACTLARANNARLSILHVHVPIYLPSVDGDCVLDEPRDAVARRCEEAYLRNVVHTLAPQPDLVVVTEVVDGPVQETVTSYAQALHATLLLMTSHGRGGLVRLWLGSTADRLIRQCNVPMLVLRPCARHGQQPRSAGCRRILIPLDGTALDEDILGPAIELGAPLRASYTLLGVVRPLVLHAFGPSGTLIDLGHEATDALRHLASARLEAAAGRLRSQSLEVETTVVVDREPAAAILREARTRNVDVIAMVTHGRGGLSRLVVGSVPDKVRRGADTAMLVYHCSTKTSEQYRTKAPVAMDEASAVSV